jgi:hypothetical protein
MESGDKSPHSKKLTALERRPTVDVYHGRWRDEIAERPSKVYNMKSVSSDHRLELDSVFCGDVVS